MPVFFILAILLLTSMMPGAVQAQDTVLYARDSALDVPTDPTLLFFQQGEKSKTPGKVILVLKNKKSKSLKSFLAGFGYDNNPSPYADHAFADLDKDGKKELLVYNYTGGAHCCDEIYIFSNSGPNKYRYAGKLFAGNSIFTTENRFIFHFTEQFGYFFTCFACGYADSAIVENFSIQVQYKKGRLQVVAGDAAYKMGILKNLKALGSKPYQPLEAAIGQDDGWRKEFAYNLAAYYFSFGKNIAATKSLFLQYYKYPDTQAVWKQFVVQLNHMRRENDF